MSEVLHSPAHKLLLTGLTPLTFWRPLMMVASEFKNRGVKVFYVPKSPFQGETEMVCHALCRAGLKEMEILNYGMGPLLIVLPPALSDDPDWWTIGSRLYKVKPFVRGSVTDPLTVTSALQVTAMAVEIHTWAPRGILAGTMHLRF